KTPEYMTMNPNARVPTIDDDGFILWESHAIVRYLSRKHGAGSLWPSDARICADADRWMDWYATTLWENVRPIFWTLVRTPPEQRDMKQVEASRQKLAADLQIVEKQLSGKQFITGSAFTMGDIPMGVALHRWFTLPIERPDYPNLHAYYGRLKQRPAYAQHCAGPLTG